MPCRTSIARVPWSCWLYWMLNSRLPRGARSCTRNCSSSTPTQARATRSFRAVANSSRISPKPRNAHPSLCSWRTPTRAKTTPRMNSRSTMPCCRNLPSSRRTCLWARVPTTIRRARRTPVRGTSPNRKARKGKINAKLQKATSPGTRSANPFNWVRLHRPHGRLVHARRNTHAFWSATWRAWCK